MTPDPMLRSQNHRRRACRGFSLVEIVLALSVVAIGLVGVMALYPVGLKANRNIVLTTHLAAVENQVSSLLRGLWREEEEGSQLRSWAAWNYQTGPWRDMRLVNYRDRRLSSIGGLDWDADGFPDFHVQVRAEARDQAEALEGMLRLHVRIGYPVEGRELLADFDYSQVRYFTVELTQDWREGP